MSHPRNTGREPRTLTPEEYLGFASRGNLHAEWGSKYSITVSGSVVVEDWDPHIKILPEASIKGDLTVPPESKVETILCGVSGDANISGCRVKVLGAGFWVGGRLDAVNCSQITTLCGRFPGAVDLSGSGVKFLGEDFTCGQGLYIQHCGELETLDCTVRGDTFADYSSLRVLGPNFHCGGALGLADCANLRSVGPVKGPPSDVFLSGSGVRETLAGFFCRGDLIAQDCGDLEKLHGGVGGAVTVGGAAALREVSLGTARAVSFSHCPALETVHVRTDQGGSFHRCAMKGFSAGSRVAGALHISQCENFCEIGGPWGGNVTLADLPSLRGVRPDFRCEEGLIIRRCENMKSIAGEVQGTAVLEGTGQIGVIGPGFSVGVNLFLECRHGDLKAVGCSVGQDAKITGPGRIEETLVSFNVGGDVVVQHLQNFRVMRGRVGGAV